MYSNININISMIYFCKVFFPVPPKVFLILSWSSPNTKICIVPLGNEDVTYFLPKHAEYGKSLLPRGTLNIYGVGAGQFNTLTFQGWPVKIPCIYVCTLSMSLLLWAAENLFTLKISHKHIAILWDIFNVNKFSAAHL